jgi:hypothetical protein
MRDHERGQALSTPGVSFWGKEKTGTAALLHVPGTGWAARRFVLSVTHTPNQATRVLSPQSPERSNPLSLFRASPVASAAPENYAMTGEEVFAGALLPG